MDLEDDDTIGLGPLVPVAVGGLAGAAGADAVDAADDPCETSLPMQLAPSADGLGADGDGATLLDDCDADGKKGPLSRPWTAEEDAMVRSLVDEHGTKRWSVIAASLPGRTGKQCRERWHNQLDPAIKKDIWSVQGMRIHTHTEDRPPRRQVAEMLSYARVSQRTASCLMPIGNWAIAGLRSPSCFRDARTMRSKTTGIRRCVASSAS